MDGFLANAVMSAANGLMGDDATDVNPEYSRAIVELTSDLLGLSGDERDETLREILRYRERLSRKFENDGPMPKDVGDSSC